MNNSLNALILNLVRHEASVIPDNYNRRIKNNRRMELFVMQLLAKSDGEPRQQMKLIHVDTRADTSMYRMRVSCLQDEPFEVDFLRYQRGGNSRRTAWAAPQKEVS